MVSAHKSIALVAFLCCFALVYATKGWYRVVAAGDYTNIFNSPVGPRPIFDYGVVGENYKTEPTTPEEGYRNEYEIASKGNSMRLHRSIADDFDVPNGKRASKIMVAVQGGRSYSPYNASNPSLMTISLIEHNTTTKTPDHWRLPIKIFRFTEPMRGWHNMSFDDLSALPLGRSTGFVRGMFDWFELDVSDLNNGTGLSPGKYWLDFKTIVSHNSVFITADNRWSSGNNYVIAMSYGTIVRGSTGLRIYGINPGFGLRAKIPHITAATAYENDGYILGTHSVMGPDAVSWRDTTTCQYDTTDAGCDISMNVFLWTDVTIDDANWTQVSLPPPTCVRNSVPWPSAFWSKDKIAPENFGCPSRYYDYTDPSMGPSPVTVPSSSTDGVSPVPIVPSPISHSPNVTLVSIVITLVSVLIVSMLLF